MLQIKCIYHTLTSTKIHGIENLAIITNQRLNCLKIKDWLGILDWNKIRELKRIIVVDCGIQASNTACVEGKMSRKHFTKRSATKTSTVLDLLHTDLCGPISNT